MNQLQTYTIHNQTLLAQGIYQMTLEGDASWIKRPGQFMNLQVSGCYLRRPISISDSTDNSITIVYKVVGKGTKTLSELQPGAALEALIDLGNGFDINILESHCLLVGGGVGIPPLVLLSKQLRKKNKDVTVILGFNSVEDVFYDQVFQDLGCKVLVCTKDGSYGEKGMVSDVMKTHQLEHLVYYTCGPYLMMKAVAQISKAEGQLSLEEKMGCGFGACMGCTCKTKEGHKRLCVEGPVLSSKEILWED